MSEQIKGSAALAGQISVLIPTCNRADLLERAVESVISQDLRPAEIIVIDDGSTDRTDSVVAAATRRTTVPVHYLRQPNRGPAAARNRGIAEAASPYLAFLDSDDEWHRDKLRVQYEAMRRNAEYLVSHTREIWYRAGRFLNQKKIHIPRHGDIFTSSLRLCCVGMSTVMARRELFPDGCRFDESLRCCEDYDLWLRTAARHSFLLVDRPLTTKHGGRPDQVSFRYRTGMDRFRIQSLARLLHAGTLTRHQENQARKELRRKCLIYGNGCKKRRKSLEANHYLTLAGRLEPNA